MRAHIRSGHPPKALAMSFHGTPGTGKNFVAQHIVKYFYKEGSKSKYYHFFSGRLSFPLEKNTFMYEVCLFHPQLSRYSCQKGASQYLRRVTTLNG